MPLTGPQTLLHWRTWSRVVDANDWVMASARLDKGATRTAGLSIYHKLVWQSAERLALQQHRAVTADDLRHACYLVASTEGRAATSGRAAVTSMKDLNNRTFSRVLVLFALLIDPDDLDANMKWDHPEISEGQGLDKSIEKMAPDAYVREIAARIYGTRLWENLAVNQKRNLRRILSERRKNWNPARHQATKTPSSDSPSCLSAPVANQPF